MESTIWVESAEALVIQLQLICEQKEDMKSAVFVACLIVPERWE